MNKVKKYWLLAVVLCCAITALRAQEDTTRYLKYPNTYGIKYPRVWASSILRTPFNDTSAINAQPGAIMAGLDGNPYWWNGQKWNGFISGNTGDFVKFIDSLIKYVTPTQLKDSLNVVRATAASTYYPIPPGTTAQYVRGNGSLATFPTGLPPTGEASGDLSGTYPGPTVTWSNGYTTYDARYPTIGNSMGFVATISQLQSFGSPSSLLANQVPLTVQVSDNKLGGIFNYYAMGYTVDTALVYPATGMGGGYWVRQITDGKYYAQWWNIDSTQTSTNNQRRAKRMFDGAGSGWHIIFDRGNKLLFDSAVYVHGKDNLFVEGLNYNRDSSRIYLTNVTFDTCRRLTLINCRFWGASAFNTDAQRRSGCVLSNCDYFSLQNNTYSHYKKNGQEVLSCSYGSGYNLQFDSCSRDGLSLSPAQYCNFYNCTNQNSALGGMEFSDSTNHCGLYNYTSINTVYAVDKDYHIAGQSNSDNTVDGATAIGCGSFLNHGTPATETVVEHNWRFMNITCIGTTGASGHGDFFWAAQTQGVLFQNITILRPLYTGQPVFTVSAVDNIIFDNIIMDDSLDNNGIKVSSGPFTNVYGEGVKITNCIMRSMKSTTSGRYAVSVDFMNHVKIEGNIFTGIPTYAGNGISVGTVNDIYVIHNTVDSMPNGYGVLLSASVACSGGAVLNNYGLNSQRCVNFSGTLNAGISVVGNIGPSSGAGLQTVSQAFPYRWDNGMVFTPSARSLAVGNAISQGIDTTYTLYAVSNQKSHIAGFFYDASHGYTITVDASGNTTVANTTGSTNQTINAGTVVFTGAGQTNATQINSVFAWTSSNNAQSTTFTSSNFKTALSTRAILSRIIERGGQSVTMAVNTDYIGHNIGIQGATIPGSSTNNVIALQVLPASITNASGGTVPINAAAVFGIATGGSLNYSGISLGRWRFDELMDFGGTVLTSNQVPVVNNAGTAMTGATVEQLSVPKVVASAILTAQTATTNIVTYTTGAADSTFDISGRLTVTAFTAGTVQLTVNYTDETSTSRTGTFYPMGSATAALSAAGASNFPVMGSLRVKASTTITVIATVTGTLTFTGAAKIIKLP